MERVPSQSQQCIFVKKNVLFHWTVWFSLNSIYQNFNQIFTMRQLISAKLKMAGVKILFLRHVDLNECHALYINSSPKQFLGRIYLNSFINFKHCTCNSGIICTCFAIKTIKSIPLINYCVI
jgi:hypothetical protein